MQEEIASLCFRSIMELKPDVKSTCNDKRIRGLLEILTVSLRHHYILPGLDKAGSRSST